MANVRIDFNEIRGDIHPMHAVGQPPFGGALRGFDFSPTAFSLQKDEIVLLEGAL